MNQPDWLTDCGPLQHTDIPQLKTIAAAEALVAKLQPSDASAMIARLVHEFRAYIEGSEEAFSAVVDQKHKLEAEVKKNRETIDWLLRPR